MQIVYGIIPKYYYNGKSAAKISYFYGKCSETMGIPSLYKAIYIDTHVIIEIFLYNDIVRSRSELTLRNLLL